MLNSKLTRFKNVSKLVLTDTGHQNYTTHYLNLYIVIVIVLNIVSLKNHNKICISKRIGAENRGTELAKSAANAFNQHYFNILLRNVSIYIGTRVIIQTRRGTVRNTRIHQYKF